MPAFGHQFISDIEASVVIHIGSYQSFLLGTKTALARKRMVGVGFGSNGPRQVEGLSSILQFPDVCRKSCLIGVSHMSKRFGMIMESRLERSRARTKVEAGLIHIVSGHVTSIDNVVREAHALQWAINNTSCSSAVTQAIGMIALPSDTWVDISAPTRVQDFLVMGSNDGINISCGRISQFHVFPVE